MIKTKSLAPFACRDVRNLESAQNSLMEKKKLIGQATLYPRFPFYISYQWVNADNASTFKANVLFKKSLEAELEERFQSVFFYYNASFSSKNSAVKHFC